MHPFEVPPAMVDQVIDSMIHELQFQSDDERAKALRDQALRQNFLEPARRRTQNTLILWHVTQKEKLQVTDDEVKSRVDQTIASMGMNDPKQLAKIRKNIEPRVRENMIFEKAMNFLIDHAAVTEVPADL
jgi:trigger factor